MIILSITHSNYNYKNIYPLILVLILMKLFSFNLKEKILFNSFIIYYSLSELLNKEEDFQLEFYNSQKCGKKKIKQYYIQEKKKLNYLLDYPIHLI